MKLERTNFDGRYEIELRQDGPESPSIAKRHKPPRRILRVSCEAKVDEGERSLRFVLKDIKADKWADNAVKIVKSSSWEPIELDLAVAPTIDLLFRIDDEKPSIVPSTLFLRKLVIAEQS